MLWRKFGSSVSETSLVRFFSLIGDTNLDTLKSFNHIKGNTENIAVSCGQTVIAQYL